MSGNEQQNAEPGTKQAWDDYFHPIEKPTAPPVFKWEDWVTEHVKYKLWKDEWKTFKPDANAAAINAQKMHDLLAGDGDTKTGLGCPPEIAKDLSLLTLYDLVMLVDDSTSMEFTEKKDPSDDDTTARKRKDTLLKVLEEVCATYECIQEDKTKGVNSIKFFNTRTGWGNVTKSKLDTKKRTFKCQGVTRIGSELKRKIVEQYVFKKDNSAMQKPLLVIVITDGKVFVTLKVHVEGESEGLLEHVVINCVLACEADATGRGKQAVSFQFAQVGRDREAAIFLKNLSKDSKVGKYVDCVLNTSLDYIYKDEMKWGIIAQLLLGAIQEQWSNKNAPILWKEQPTKGMVAARRSSAKDDNDDPYDDDDLPPDESHDHDQSIAYYCKKWGFFNVSGSYLSQSAYQFCQPFEYAIYRTEAREYIYVKHALSHEIQPINREMVLDPPRQPGSNFQPPQW
ncbi:hypothetical protein K440DRAFT_662074 [Wilcoxina mikolae CBS 423.85]|nr:hypothetical protein K440DRAFT_662074 [Wilcoxina mikolae CBS 423.85]